ncbi:hypothetical protein G5B40_14030 [Pikeienuella piscinae]|uniref:Uncharacterized protein n=2 Tax=Pikeienuella piscinae TaxID=2748098 RepID=A0A7M3T7B7_9RHOB|nr:hypothetical protein G5B40_14030 [Pikeienuella piscinae]
MLSSAARSCPDYHNYVGETYSVSGSYLYQPRYYRVRAGGDRSLSACPVRLLTDNGPGFVTAQPDFTFGLADMRGYQLKLEVISECDSVLLINTATEGWYYDDDDAGNGDARIILTRPADGRLDVWVGSYSGETCDAVLALETYRR